MISPGRGRRGGQCSGCSLKRISLIGPLVFGRIRVSEDRGTLAVTGGCHQAKEQLPA